MDQEPLQMFYVGAGEPDTMMGCCTVGSQVVKIESGRNYGEHDSCMRRFMFSSNCFRVF
ncbi:hypothetical protein BDA96_09G114200 [Sorghum bicolor]|uniref:Uncharacterized protein n=1 Tax=Sorghum bicolor TaxID=4558 RepID=A0A921Q927_SORBI|nr:hypothetical protein BDA96_09G114200 [Sorghum bicolor]